MMVNVGVELDPKSNPPSWIGFLTFTPSFIYCGVKIINSQFQVCLSLLSKTLKFLSIHTLQSGIEHYANLFINEHKILRLLQQSLLLCLSFEGTNFHEILWWDTIWCNATHSKQGFLRWTMVPTVCI